MTAYVVTENRGYEIDAKTGARRHRVWWWFFTQPYVYSVWWRPDGSKTMDEFLAEQVARVKAHLFSANQLSKEQP